MKYMIIFCLILMQMTPVHAARYWDGKIKSFCQKNHPDIVPKYKINRKTGRLTGGEHVQKLQPYID